MNSTLMKHQQRDKATLKHLTKVMEEMHTKMERRSAANEVHMLKHLVQSMQTATAALSLPHYGTAPLFLGLNLASAGIYSTESAAGIIGPSIARLMQALTAGIISELLPQADPAKRRFLALSLLTSYALLSCLASRASGEGIGTFAEDLSQADLKSARVFGCELALLLFNSAGTLEEAFKMIIESCGGDERAQKIGGPLLAQIGNLLMIVAATQGSLRKPAEVIGEQEKYILRGTGAAADAIAKTSGSETSAVAAVSVALQQLQMALNEKNDEGCVETLRTLLENLGTSWEALLADIKQLKKSVNMIIETIAQRSEEAFTGTVHVA